MQVHAGNLWCSLFFGLFSLFFSFFSFFAVFCCLGDLFKNDYDKTPGQTFLWSQYTSERVTFSLKKTLVFCCISAKVLLFLLKWLKLMGLFNIKEYAHAIIISLPPSFLAVNHRNIENWVPTILTHNLWLIFMGMRQKIQNGRLKKGHFSTLSILNIFLWKFHGSVLGLVELIDAKGIDGAQPIWSWGCPT